MCRITESATLDVDILQNRMKTIHDSGVNLTYKWRIHQIKQLYRMLRENIEGLREALVLDLGRQGNEAIAVDISCSEADIKYAMSNLKQWMKPQAIPSPLLMLGRSYIEPRPLNSPGVLIIGPYNYPLRLLIQPLLGALAGGNPAVLKPSELTPHCAAIMKNLVEKYFAPEVVQVVLGGVPETTALLEKRWGMVFFTGSERVGKIVETACASTLTPTTLELGGKCPVVVDETVAPSKIQNVANRIVFGKLLNAGQTCVAPDTVFVHESHVKQFGEAIVRAIDTQYGKGDRKPELARIATKALTKRSSEMLEEAEKLGGKVLYGGSTKCNIEENYIAPTIILNPPKEAKILQEEVFAPATAIVTFCTRKEAIELIQDLPGEPLQLYVFTPDVKVFDEFTAKCRSAGAVRNDVIIQGSSFYLPLGGIGSSGHGKYFGKASFDTFSHTFGTVHRSIGTLYDLGNLRCHPYEGGTGWLLENVLIGLPSIPNLHIRRSLVLIGLCGIVAASQDAQNFLKSALISILEGLLAQLKD